MRAAIASGFGFLCARSWFEIGERTFLSYNAGRHLPESACAVGLLNTFRVAMLAIVFSTIIGVLDRFSSPVTQLVCGEIRRWLHRAVP